MNDNEQPSGDPDVIQLGDMAIHIGPTTGGGLLAELDEHTQRTGAGLQYARARLAAGDVVGARRLLQMAERIEPQPAVHLTAAQLAPLLDAAGVSVHLGGQAVEVWLSLRGWSVSATSACITQRRRREAVASDGKQAPA